MMLKRLVYTSLLTLFLAVTADVSAMSQENNVVLEQHFKPKKKKHCKSKIKARKKQIKEKAKSLKKAKGKMKSKNKAVSTYI
jgi:hypothetical protein